MGLGASGFPHIGSLGDAARSNAVSLALKEMGLNWSEGAWRGITVPKGTPTEVVAVLEKSLDKAVKNPKFREFMDKNGFGIWWKPAGEFDKFLAEQDGVKGKIMKEAGLIK